eukprot:2638341-Rhodomonas_salina.1
MAGGCVSERYRTGLLCSRGLPGGGREDGCTLQRNRRLYCNGQPGPGGGAPEPRAAPGLLAPGRVDPQYRAERYCARRLVLLRAW